MAKVKIVDKDVEEIKKYLKENKIIIGSKQVIKGLQKETLAKVYLASSCKKETAANIKHFCKIGGTEIIELVLQNEELGVICKKPFAISALGVIR